MLSLSNETENPFWYNYTVRGQNQISLAYCHWNSFLVIIRLIYKEWLSKCWHKMTEIIKIIWDEAWKMSDNFFICYLAAPQTTLDHYGGEKLIHSMLITVTGSLVMRLGPSTWWDLKQEPRRFIATS